MKLTPKHYQAIELIAAGRSSQDIAEQIDVARETISRWKADFNFQAELNTLLKANQRATQDKLRHLSTVALETIETLMTDAETPVRDRLTASLKIIEIAKVDTPFIGSTNPVVLQKEKEQDDLSESFQFW